MSKPENEQQKSIRRERKRVRKAYVRAMCLRVLGGACAKCGSRERLEVDHVVPALKSFQPTTECNRSDESILNELAKCQLLCPPCHHLKSTLERGAKPAVHGSCAMYFYHRCRCDACRIANREYHRGHRLRQAERRRIQLNSAGKGN